MTDIWTYLARDPLLWLSMTVAAYAFGLVVFNYTGRMPALNPAIVAMAALSLVLLATGTSFETYFEARNSSISCWARRRSALPCRFTIISRGCAAPRCRS